MHTIGATRQCNVKTVVDDDARLGSPGTGNRVSHQSHKCPSFKIAFADLNHVHTGVDGVPQLRLETRHLLFPLRTWTEPPAVGHEMQDQGRLEISCRSCPCRIRGPQVRGRRTPILAAR